MKSVLKSMLVGATALAAGAAGAALTGSAGAQDYSGITVNILTRPGPVIAQRMVERGEEFTELTGAEIRVDEVPFAELFQKLLTDWATGTNSIDVGVFASGWAVEMVDGGLLEDLTDYVANDARSTSTTSRRTSANTIRRSAAKPIWSPSMAISRCSTIAATSSTRWD